MAKLTLSHSRYRAHSVAWHRSTSASAEAPGLAWLLLNLAGGALVALVLAGVALAHSPWPLTGRPLLVAAFAGAALAAARIVRGRWAARWPELAAVLLAVTAIGGLGCWLAWPSLLPLGSSVDAAHHAQLLGWVAEHQRAPAPTADMQGQLGEMSGYPLGFVLLALAAAQALAIAPIHALYPSAALLGALIAGLVVVLAGAASRRPGQGRLSALGLLVAPLLLLAHRTFLLDAYLDQSYYTMLFGVFLVLLAIAWLVVPARWSWGAAAQFGLALAALAATYPLWLPLPAALALGFAVARRAGAPGGDPLQIATKQQRPAAHGVRPTWHALEASRIFASAVLRGNAATAHYAQGAVLRNGSSRPALALAGGLTLAYAPALAVVLLDTLPRLRIGQQVLAHQGVVAQPTPAHLAPLALALLAAPLLLGAARGRRLLGAAGLTLAGGLVLGLLAQRGGVASYHAYKLLFLLTPLAAAVAGAGAARLLSITPGGRSLAQQARFWSSGRLAGAARSPQATPAADRRRAAIGWRCGQLAVIMLALAASGSLPARLPARPVQLLTPELVAATQWLRLHMPREAARAPVLGTPNGLLPYWLRVGLLGQRRDSASLQHPDLTQPPPSPAGWLLDQRQAQVAIVPQLGQPPPDSQVLARFGAVDIVQRNAQIDTGALNPLRIHYRSFWEDQRIKTAIELDQPQPGALPQLELALYHGGALINRFALAADPQRSRTQYLGADLIAATLGGVGYINTSSYPAFAAPTEAPAGALTLRLRLLVDSHSVDERELASFVRGEDGQIGELVVQSGELVYLRSSPAEAPAPSAAIDFGANLRLAGWQMPAQIARDAPITVGLRWQALGRIERSLFPEIQLLDQAGQPVAVSLSAPQDGFYPTWRWRPGEEVSELRSLRPAAALAPGRYRLSLRVHDFAAQRVLRPAAAQLEFGTLMVVP